MTRLSISIAAVLVPAAASAHPDHFSGASHGLAHWLGDPFHMGLVAGAALLAVAGARMLRRRPVRIRRER